MKKILLIGVIVLLSMAVNAQNFFKSVSPFPTVDEKISMVSRGIMPLERKVAWRFDAAVAFTEFVWNKEAKQFSSQMFSAIGPAIGVQWYRPTSETDPTPFNIYGVSAAVLLGKDIYQPDLAALKVALVANIYQYFKFGPTFTPNAIDKWGVFIGGGVTF